MPRFSANLGFLWPGRPLLDQIESAARAGFRAVELHWPYDTPAAAVRDACARHGVTLLGVNTVRGDVGAGENGLGALPGREGEFQAAIDQSLAFCREAGATSVHCMAGRVPCEARAVGRATLLDNLRRASDKAEAAGVLLLLEPLNPVDAPGYFYGTADEGRRDRGGARAPQRAPHVRLIPRRPRRRRRDRHHGAADARDRPHAGRGRPDPGRARRRHARLTVPCSPP